MSDSKIYSDVDLFDPRMQAWTIRQEGAETIRGEDGLFKVYNDQGKEASGHGHNFKPGEEVRPLNDDEAAGYLASDWLEAAAATRSFININDGAGSFERLPKRHQQLLVDIQFNVKGGVATYPKLRNALHTQDIEAARFESYRSFGEDKKPLPRNQPTLDEFLSGPREREAARPQEVSTPHKVGDRAPEVATPTPVKVTRQPLRYRRPQARQLSVALEPPSPELPVAKPIVTSMVRGSARSTRGKRA